LKPIGILIRSFFEDLFSQTFDASKLEKTPSALRQAYRDKATTTPPSEEPKTHIRDQGGLNWFKPSAKQGQTH